MLMLMSSVYVAYAEDTCPSQGDGSLICGSPSSYSLIPKRNFQVVFEATVILGSKET